MHADSFYLNKNSEYCQTISGIVGDTKCINFPPFIDHKTTEVEKILKITPQDSLDSIGNILRYQYFERIGKPLKRRLMLSNTLGKEPRGFLAEFKSSFAKCSSYQKELMGVVEFATSGHTIFKDQKEQSQYKTSLIKRYKIALVELYRLEQLKKYKKKKGLDVERVDESINHIYAQYPTIKTILSKYPSVTYGVTSGLMRQLKLHIFIPTNVTHPDINEILNMDKNLIDISESTDNQKNNVYQQTYQAIIDDNALVDDLWLNDKIVESDFESTAASITFLGDICQMSACELVESSPSEVSDILSQTFKYGKIQVEQYICNKCNLGTRQKTFSNKQNILASLGAVGLGVGCIISAPVCIPAAIATGGMAYMSVKNYQDSTINEKTNIKITQKRSMIAKESKDYEISLRELEESQKDKFNATLQLALDSTFVAGELYQSQKLVSQMLSNLAKTNNTFISTVKTVKLLAGDNLSDIPSESLEVFLKVSRSSDYIATADELALLKSHNLLNAFDDWKNTNKMLRLYNEKMMLLYRSKIKSGDDNSVLKYLKLIGKGLLPMYKSFQFNTKVKGILHQIIAYPDYMIPAAEKAFLKQMGAYDDVLRFQKDVKIGLQKGFATIEKIKTVGNKTAWGVALTALGANLFVDEYITREESISEKTDKSMSRYDGKVELIFTSPAAHVSLRIGGLVYNYGQMKVERYNLDQYKNSAGFGEVLSGSHIRIELNLTPQEKKNLIKYLEEDVGKFYPLAIPFVDCISQTNNALRNVIGLDVPVIMDRSQALTIGYFNMLKLSNSDRVKKVTFASHGNTVASRMEESAVNVLDALMFARFSPMLVVTNPILDKFKLTFDLDEK